MDNQRREFSCVASGSFHQGNYELFGWSAGAQCVVNSSCAAAWGLINGTFNTDTINSILFCGNRIYRTLRDDTFRDEERYIYPEELPGVLEVMGNFINVDVSDVHYGIYPITVRDVEEGVRSLSGVLEGILSVSEHLDAFMFTGELRSITFWHRGDSTFLFDSHGVNYDYRSCSDGRASLFKCNTLLALASMLLSNNKFNGRGNQYTITRLRFSRPPGNHSFATSSNATASTTENTDNNSRSSISQDPKLNIMKPVVLLTRKENIDTNITETSKQQGRPKKAKRGRPKLLDTTRKEQLIAARKKHAEKNPNVNREAVKRYAATHPEVKKRSVKIYTGDHPDVNRKAAKRYTNDHPDVHRRAVQRLHETNPEASRQTTVTYRLRHPELENIRHIPAALARKIVHLGPMAYWKGLALDDVEAFKLKRTSLWEDDVHRCAHCRARIFDEERNRKKWCCAEGAFNVQRLPSLDAPFYSKREFLDRSRAYNDLFAFCALEVSGGYRHPSGLSFFKIEGRMYHQLHSLEAPGQRFTTRAGHTQFVNRCRLYIDDGEERRNIALGRTLNTGVIEEIDQYIRNTNPFIENFRRLSAEPSIDAHLTFEVTSRSTHGPTLGDRQSGIEVHAALSTEETGYNPRKLTVWKRGDRRPSSIDLLSPLMEPFQYPLLYPQGTLGWHVGSVDNQGKKLTQLNYSRCLLLSDRRFSHLGRLSQAWQVEMFARYEEERLRFIQYSQTRSSSGRGMRIAPLDEILDVGRQQRGQIAQDITGDETVQGEGGVRPGKVYLPSTFTGGPRYMKVHYENAMGIVSRLGSPTYFLTFTYSAHWEENKMACPYGSKRSDPSTACRVFNIKLGELIRDLRSGAFFGRTSYFVYVIEMQMRGLPHAHIVFKVDGVGPVQAEEIDAVIRADIPSEEEAGGRLRRLVLQHMIHGPCGTDQRTDFRCWDAAKGCCSKFYPKPSCQTTHVNERGFVQYKRDYSNRGIINARRREISVHDGWVVPYNAALILKYEAHINLELASTRRVVKYLFKYLMKGGSLQNVTVTPIGLQDDEVEQYVTKRMVGASDACWRLLEFPISKSEPTVECLPVHLEGKQNVVYRPRDCNLTEIASSASSKLMIYFNRPRDAIFDDLTYQSFYEKYIVHTRSPGGDNFYALPDGVHYVTARQRGVKVCRLFWISPNRGEQYYLRILLMTTPCRGYADLLSRGVGNCRTFQDVARSLGLVEDEEEYADALGEASEFMVAHTLRSFFVLLCNIGAPGAILWEKYKNSLSEDYLDRHPENPDAAYTSSLLAIDRGLRRQGSCLTDHGLPYVQDVTTELSREQVQYSREKERSFVDEWQPKLSEDQKIFYTHIESLFQDNNRRDRILFLDGPGGYGKTALLRVILAYARGHGYIALAVASSGIAASNMQGGTTAHSMFRLPIDLGDGTGYWNVSNGSQRAALIREAKIIIFDEAPMAHHYIFQILDRSLRDLMDNDLPFGGKIFVCSGDFRQIAPVVKNARTPADVSCVSLRSSPMWRFFKIFSLTTPQRTGEYKDYSDFLLQVGNGRVDSISFGEGRLQEALIPLRGLRGVTSLRQLIEDIFPPCVLSQPELCAKRAILSTLNANVKEINDLVLDSSDGCIHELRSADSVCKENDNDGLDVDFQLLHQATGNGIPDHVLRLKVGSVCLIMRNLNIGDGLVNGTKVIVTAISKRLITVKMPGKTHRIGIPRISFRFPFTEGSPLQVLRRQFPLALAYSMTGHKSQGQTIEYVGIDLRTNCFTHGQLYVLLSRVRRPQDIVVLVPQNKIVDGIAYAKNVVFEELLL
ncbi:uncharacterized protein LOC124158205 [Ischnura elegans]|uniref:uncharacterized protein LOC124158204 n=1 Tax=Ischnura elegans TaxID=197161 RepID=UPI001ED87112|nr:uncharacterized protein LOC124158204 [Ischnura elegans]XP_046389349.1 uncharacterized protein LOC124158205 [Ischnura elegans]